LSGHVARMKETKLHKTVVVRVDRKCHLELRRGDERTILQFVLHGNRLYGWDVDGRGSTLCPVVAFGISHDRHFGSVTSKSVDYRNFYCKVHSPFCYK
jgi:hypothetical protein